MDAVLKVEAKKDFSSPRDKRNRTLGLLDEKKNRMKWFKLDLMKLRPSILNFDLRIFLGARPENHFYDDGYHEFSSSVSHQLRTLTDKLILRK